MFIRKTRIINRKTKKSYFNFQLVESFRTERGPRQRILLNLGANLDLDKQACKILANRIETLVTGQEEFIAPPERLEKLAQHFAQKLVRNLSVPIEKKEPTATVPDYQTVDFNTLTLKEARTVGCEGLLMKIISELKLPLFLKKTGFSPMQINLALGTIVARAVFPGSERSSFFWLQNQSGLGELLNFDFKKIDIKKFYQISDLLLKHKERLEKYLEVGQRKIHGITSTLILYDLTNTYMEGQAKLNPKAKHGFSKEKRTDCPLITLGLLIDEHGFMKQSKFLPGNISESKTLDQAIQALGCKEKLLRPTIIIDAGIATEENLDWLKKNGYTYIVSARQSPPSKEVDGEYMLVGQKGEIKVADLKRKESEDRWLICSSPSKEATASAMKTLFQQRFEEDLKKLHEGLSKPRGRKKFEKVLQRIGRLKEKHRRIAGCYDITVTPSADQKIALAVEWKPLPEKLNERLTAEYYLRTNLIDKGAKELWDIYNILRKIEDSFRFMKSTLGLRPIYHQKESRVDGHLWITILAYSLIQDISYRLQKKGIMERWETIRNKMSSRVRVTMQMQTNLKKTIYIRSTTEPESYHQNIYSALNFSPEILPAKKSIL